MIEQNMTASGFGKVLEVEGFTYVDDFDRDSRVFFPAGWKVDKTRFHSPTPEVCRFQQYEPGGAGRPQYVMHSFANWKSAKVISENGPGNIHDAQKKEVA